MKYKKFLPQLIILLMFLLVSCRASDIVFAPVTKDSVKGELSASACQDSTADKIGVKDSKWIDEKTLEVKAFITMNCAEAINGFGFTVSDTGIALTCNIPKCKTCTDKCLCMQELTYKFSNIKSKKTYTYTLNKTTY